VVSAVYHGAMRLIPSISLLAVVAASASAQSSIAACGPLPDSTSRQQIRNFGDLRVCMVATKVVGTEAETPIEWAAKGAVVVLETQRPGDNRRAAISGSDVAWTINGRVAPLDSLAERWQKLVTEVLDASFAANELRSQDSSLRIDADSLPARRAATQKRISDIERLQAELNRQLLAEQTRESSLNGQLQRLEAQRDDYQRRAAAEERKAAGTRDERSRSAYEANARSYYAQAQNVSEQIRRLESDGRNSSSSRRIAELRQQLGASTADGNETLLRMKLANYDSTRVEDLRQQINQLAAAQQLPVLDARVEKARLALLALLEARDRSPSR
jgi:hypothetical protein